MYRVVWCGLGGLDVGGRGGGGRIARSVLGLWMTRKSVLAARTTQFQVNLTGGCCWGDGLQTIKK